MSQVEGRWEYRLCVAEGAGLNDYAYTYVPRGHLSIPTHQYTCRDSTLFPEELRELLETVGPVLRAGRAQLQKQRSPLCCFKSCGAPGLSPDSLPSLREEVETVRMAMLPFRGVL